MSKKDKTLFLTKEEKQNVVIRRNKIQDKDYEKHLIQNDLDLYVRQVILPRLGKSIESKYGFSEDSASIEIYEPGLSGGTTASESKS